MRLPFTILCSVACCLAIKNNVQADQRRDATALLEKLRQRCVSARMQDELRSMDSTLARAETLYRQHDIRNAERYYQLALQKGKLIQTHLAASVPAVPTDSLHKAVSTSSSTSESPANYLKSALSPAEQNQEYFSSRLIGSAGTYKIVKGDTIRLIAAKLGVNYRKLAAMNGLDLKDRLKPGQLLKYNNRRIIPEHRIKDGLLINIPDRTLYLFKKGTATFTTAVALGTPTKTEQFVWQTPTGRFRIINKTKDPVWNVPPSIQEEMRLEGKEVITSVPPGKTNPLGKYAIKTSLPGILIHSTSKPWSIYTFASHGCIRVYPERMEELFNLVKVNSTGEIIYRPVKLAVTDDGRILMEVHSDIYKRTKGLSNEAKELIRANNLEQKVDWKKVKQVISNRSGIAEEITSNPVETQQTSGEIHGKFVLSVTPCIA